MRKIRPFDNFDFGWNFPKNLRSSTYKCGASSKHENISSKGKYVMLFQIE